MYQENAVPSTIEENGIMYQIRQKYGIVADSDSYKLTHHSQYIPGAQRMASYVESRGGEYDKAMMFGLQLIIKEFFLQRLTHEQVDNIITWSKKHMMDNVTDDLEVAFRAVVDDYDGYLPISIKAAPEGAIIPVGNVLMIIETSVDDTRIFSLVSYFETKLLRVWSPITVATRSYYIKQRILAALQKTADAPEEEIDFKLHDFGSRGGSAMEGVAFAGAGHLVNFRGSDTQVAIMALELAYGEEMAGFSIPASEHSSTGSRGRDGEIEFVANMFDKYAKPGAIFATVIDTYDALSFIRNIVPLFKDRLIESGATWVLRPDSGDPVTMPIKIVEELDLVFGHTVNKKGYKVLNHVRVIQGDGITEAEVGEILDKVTELGYSASNIGFGMGGGLLQKVDRDTLKMSMKCSAVKVDGEWLAVYKDPAVYDEKWNKINEVSFKKSKLGQLDLMWNPVTKEFITTSDEVEKPSAPWFGVLTEVYRDGKILNEYTLDEVKNNTLIYQAG